MSADELSAGQLRDYRRAPPTPCAVTLADGRQLCVTKWLRVLPGKRLTGLGSLGGQAVITKLFIAESGAHRHWTRESEGLARLKAAAVLTPDIVATGALAAGGHFLLTEYLEGAISPSSAVSPAPTSEASPATSAFAMLGCMHAQGVIQDDAHLDNFLIHDQQVYVIDGAAVRASSSTDDCLENLAILFAQWPASALGAIKTGLLAAYCASYGKPVDGVRLDAEIERVRQVRLRDFLDKCLRDCTLFKVDKRSDRFVAMVRAEEALLAPLVADPDRWLEAGTPLKRGGTATVAVVEHGGRRLVIKRYNIKGAGHALSRAWRPSRAWQSWLSGHRLRFLGIGTPAPLALIEQRLGPLRRQAWLITDYCDGQTLASRFEADRPPAAEDVAAVRRLFQQLAAAKLSHGDLKANNLIFNDGQIALIDLDAMRQHRHAGAFRRAHTRDRDRFLRNWPVGSAVRTALNGL